MAAGTTTTRRNDAPATADGRPIQVVHLVSTLRIGGLEKVVLDLVRCADRGRQQVRVWCLGEIGALGPQFEALGVEVESLGVLGTGVRRAVATVAHRLNRLRPDVLHTHNPSPHVIGAAAGRLARVPVIVHTKHGRNYPDIRRKVLANRVASYFTDVIVPVSNDAGDVCCDIERVPNRKVRVIHNGIDLEGFSVADRQAAVPGRVIHVARLIYPTKDQITLLRAARIVADARPDFHLDIVGDGPHRPMLEDLCDELQLRGSVTFHGFRHDVHHLLCQAELFVLSSVREGLSITLLEAMASGLPIVATRVGGNPEVVADGETGLLVPAGSPPELAVAMLRLLNDPVRARAMGLAGRRRVEEHFDLRRTAARYEELYLSLLEKKGRLGATVVR